MKLMLTLSHDGNALDVIIDRGSTALMVPCFTRVAAWGMIALCVAVFPANLHMAPHADLFPQFSETALWWRLPGQLVIMGWAWWFTGVRC